MEVVIAVGAVVIEAEVVEAEAEGEAEGEAAFRRGLLRCSGESVSFRRHFAYSILYVLTFPGMEIFRLQIKMLRRLRIAS